MENSSGGTQRAQASTKGRSSIDSDSQERVCFAVVRRRANIEAMGDTESHLLPESSSLGALEMPAAFQHCTRRFDATDTHARGVAEQRATRTDEDGRGAKGGDVGRWGDFEQAHAVPVSYSRA